LKAKLIAIKKNPSNLGGNFFVVCFKLDDMTSARTFVYPKCVNWLRWQKLFDLQNKEVFLDNLRWFNKDKKQIDADSEFIVCPLS